MTSNEEEFLERLLATFRVEAEEHLSAISSGLIELEKDPKGSSARETVETIFRAAHSLKGAARSVNHTESERLCHALESVLAALKRDVVDTSMELFDIVHHVVDHLRLRILDPNASVPGGAGSSRGLVRQLENLLVATPAHDEIQPAGMDLYADVEEDATYEAVGRAASVERAAPIDTVPTGDTVRLSASRMESLLVQVEELIGPKLAAAERTKAFSALATEFQAFQRQRGQSDFSEDEALATLQYKMKTLAARSEQDQNKFASMIDMLLNDMKRSLMLPFSSLFEILPKLVRDLSRSQGKHVELVVDGGEIEVDRRVLDELKDALIHIIRNCVDHGIEAPEARARAGKAPSGLMRITVSQRDGSHVEFVIADDGKGIDEHALKAAALKAGVRTSAELEGLHGQDTFALALQSGVSTSPLITDVSGRGLGLAIAQEKIDRLGGTLTIESKLREGTSFRIVLPITMATFRGILIRVGDATLVLPTLSVERVLRVTPDAIQTVENREVLRINGASVSLARLHDILELSPSRETTFSALIVKSHGTSIAFLADEVLTEQEVMVKTLGQQLSRVRNISGVAILGSGSAAPILNVQDIVKAAVRVGRGPARVAQAAPPRQPAKKILVAEDSITARSLLKGILESAGYVVHTTVDGAAALAVARTEDIDLVVSDVEMPRMNGFDLTAKIRAEKKLASVPVVLVTALESRDDRERGIEVGANAYIVKSSFDQSNLLDVIRRLL